jgi:hypothetical protein
MNENEKLFKSDPGEYALKLVEEGVINAADILLALLASMSHDDIRWALDANELSPRFSDEDGDEDDDED